jgi:uncharacterized protein (TIGR04222 family)
MQLFSSWTGGDFLLFYIALLGFGTFAAWWVPAQMRPPGRRSESLDAEDFALLTGGAVAHTDSVVADLLARGGLNAASDRKLQVTQSNLPASPAGRALLSSPMPFNLAEADAMLAIHANRIAARLRREGLLLGPDEMTRLRLFSVAPLAGLFLIGLYRQRAGAAEGEPTGLLVMLMALTIGLAVVRLIQFDKRTGEGIAAVSRMRDDKARLKRAPLAEEAGMAVALFGAGVLVGTQWEPVHALRQKDGSGDSGGSDSSSDGGGDGGGGCGGCGG